MKDKPAEEVSMFRILEMIAKEDTADGIAIFPDVIGCQKNSKGGIVSVGVAPHVANWMAFKSHYIFLLAAKKKDFHRLESELKSSTSSGAIRRDGNGYYVEKGAQVVYRIRKKGSRCWAHISFDSGVRGALSISIQSSYGSYSCTWAAAVDDPRSFLVGLGIDYLSKSFGVNRWFDHDSTIAALRESVRAYAYDSIDPEDSDALEALDNEIKALLEYDDRRSFELKAWESKMLRLTWDTGPEIVLGIDPAFRVFWEKLWVCFVDQLKAELDADSSVNI